MMIKNKDYSVLGELDKGSETEVKIFKLDEEAISFLIKWKVWY